MDLDQDTGGPKTCGSGGSGSGFGSGSAILVSKVFSICGYREESWVVPIWTMGGILTLAIILKILHLAAQHKESMPFILVEIGIEAAVSLADCALYTLYLFTEKKGYRFSRPQPGE
jgi:hypothetical protein